MTGILLALEETEASVAKSMGKPSVSVVKQMEQT